MWFAAIFECNSEEGEVQKDQCSADKKRAVDLFVNKPISIVWFALRNFPKYSLTDDDNQLVMENDLKRYAEICRFPACITTSSLC